jgi:RES domain-containing protein
MPLIQAWRLTAGVHLSTALSGEGARLYGGRWNTRGTPVTYPASSRPLAVLEVLAQLTSAADLARYALLPVRFDAACVADLPELPEDWRALPSPRSTAEVGDRWAAAGESLVLRVPSVVLPAESNYLLNPAHPASSSVDVGEPGALEIDPRLLEAR